MYILLFGAAYFDEATRQFIDPRTVEHGTDGTVKAGDKVYQKKGRNRMSDSKPAPAFVERAANELATEWKHVEHPIIQEMLRQLPVELHDYLRVKYNPSLKRVNIYLFIEGCSTILVRLHRPWYAPWRRIARYYVGLTEMTRNDPIEAVALARLNAKRYL